jgi:hypothetical protein
VQSR